MLFVGSDSHGDHLVRQLITRQCQHYRNGSVCTIGNRSPNSSILSAIALKRRALFCLEPVGDSPFRKSLSDSIALGCVPVLFSSWTDAVAPWFWGSWKARARVLVPRNDFLGGTIELRQLLSSIPPTLLQTMQATLAQKGKSFQYSLDDDSGDGIDTLLRALHSQSRKGCAR